MKCAINSGKLCVTYLFFFNLENEEKKRARDAEMAETAEGTTYNWS